MDTLVDQWIRKDLIGLSLVRISFSILLGAPLGEGQKEEPRKASVGLLAIGLSLSPSPGGAPGGILNDTVKLLSLFYLKNSTVRFTCFYTE